MKKRHLWIDFLRGLAMLLVIWGHIDRTHRLFFMITSPFKIPLFFAITGYVFNFRKGDTKSFFKNLLLKLVIPWILLSLIWIRVPRAVLQGRIPDSIDLLKRFISGTDYWFMPCCIVAEIIYFLVRKYVRKTNFQYLTMILITLAGIAMGRYGLCRFMLVDVACTAMSFICFGYWYKNNEERLLKVFRKGRCILPALLYIVLLFINYSYFQFKLIDVHVNKYFNYPFCWCMILVSLLSLFLLAETSEHAIIEKKGEIKSPLIRYTAFAGRNTLVFYLMHFDVRKAYRIVRNASGLVIPKTTPGFLFEFIIVNIVLAVIALIINKYLPFAAGKKALSAGNSKVS